MTCQFMEKLSTAILRPVENAGLSKESL